MKTIYKSIALEAALLSVTLALQAEIQSEGQTVTADVQASTLDRLKVALVSPNVSGARDLVASGNATIDGNEIAVNLENLAFGTHRLVVSARFGTQIRTLYALDISVPQAELPNETQEYEDVAIVVSTYGDGGGGGEFPTDYAKQGDDPDATLTDAQAYAQAAAEDAAAAKDAAQALSPVALAADAYNEGKPALATAISAKGVQTASTDSLATMATKVSLIAQEPIIWNDSDISHMYEKQMFGSLETPNYWNLYEILAYLLGDHYLRQDVGHVGERFGGFLLAEYYRGYPDLALSGAGSGGAYVVSDIDPQTNEFKVYYTDATHVWDTEFDGKGNRWVAYCFADEYHNFDITDTNTSPRSIFIGRKVGTITCLVNTRISDIVVPDGDNSLLGFANGGFSHNFGKKVCIRNIESITSGLIRCNGVTESIYLKADTINANSKIIHQATGNSPSPSAIIEADSINGGEDKELFNVEQSSSLPFPFVSIKANTISGWTFGGLTGAVKQLAIIAGSGVCDVKFYRAAMSALEYLYIRYFDPAAKSAISFSNYYGSTRALQDCLLQDGICRSIDVSKFDIPENGTTNYITEHILQRLKQDEPDCGDGVTITLGATNLAKLTSAESVQLLDDLTNIYGYTFA